MTDTERAKLIAQRQAERNKMMQAKELERWETKPDTQLAYFHFPGLMTAAQMYRDNFEPNIRLAYVAIWPGNLIGTITHARVYRHNLGSRFVSIKVRGTNGASYYGRASWDNGTCVNLHKAKA